ncbi:MAG: ABC transporter permease [Synechococcaceae cyanobacterium]|nr:ABC transporter permease [Synechococcaceae cyanobacterium]
MGFGPLPAVFRACGGRTLLLTVLAGATLAAGWVEIMRGPLGQVNVLTLQVISKESLNTLAPLAITLIFLVRCGPLLAFGYAELRGLVSDQDPHGVLGWVGFCRRELLGACLGALSLFVYFVAAELVMALIVTPGQQLFVEFRELLETMRLVDFITGISKTVLFVLVSTLLCCRQGFRCGPERSRYPSLVSDALLQCLMVVLLMELFWVGTLNQIVLL